MNAQLLFPGRLRTDSGISRASESTYGFLQRVDDRAFERVREVLNCWFERFASSQEATAATDLRRRIEAKQKGQFEAAFWELYLHEAFSRLGFEISVHPASERGTRPDFELRGETDDHFYLEAVMPTPGLFDRKEPVSVETVVEYVNDAFHPDFLLQLQYVIPGRQMPRKIAVRNAVLDWLNNLSWDLLWSGDLSSSERPEGRIRAGDGWEIGLKALPSPPEIRSRTKRPMIFSYRGSIGYPDALGPAILPTLYEKANKYGDLDAPLVIAVWIMETMASQDTAVLALFGSWFSLDAGEQPTGLNLRQNRPESLWGPKAKHRGRASAVLAVNSFDFGLPSIARSLPRLWPNPWASRPLGSELPFACSLVSADEATVANRAAMVTASKLFELPKDWPGQFFDGS
jgi:hypothetical protein